MEARWQYLDEQYVRVVARDVVQSVHGAEPRSVVLALRDHVRSHVTHRGLPFDGRPFLRDSAADTLRSGKGHCGEATRAFINLAAAVGISAQRLYLEGQTPHVVAEVTLEGGDELIVDAFDEPYIPDIESLDEVMRRPQFNSYSTLNGRRALRWLPSFRSNLGPVSYWIESPHLLRALFWLISAIILLLIKTPARL